MKLSAWIDGKFTEDPRISAMDHGLLYGDGVYEAIRRYGDDFFRLGEHLDRLYESAKTIRLKAPVARTVLEHVIEETAARGGSGDAYVRVVLTRGVGKMGVDTRNCGSPTLVVIAVPRPLATEARNLHARIVSVRRTPRWSLDPAAKTLNYLNEVLAKAEAIQCGCDEAIMLNGEGFVAEAPTENVFMVKSGALFTPPLSAGILGGITRKAVLEIARAMDVTTVCADLTPHDLYNADEVFVTGTGAGITQVTSVDGIHIRGRALTKRVQRGYECLTRKLPSS